MLSLPKTIDFTSDAARQSVNSLPSISGTRTVFKWQDKNGVWHYGDTRPTDISNVSTLEVDGNTNLIQSIQTRPEIDEPVTKTPELQQEGSLLSFDRALNILNEAKEVKGLMEDRNDQLNAVTGEPSNK